MVEAYIEHASFSYASEYIKKIENTLGVVVWDDERDEEKRKGELLQMNDKSHFISSVKFIHNNYSH